MRFKTRPEPQTSHVRVSSAVIPCILAACEVADPFSPAPSLQTASRYLQLEQKRPIDQHLPCIFMNWRAQIRKSRLMRFSPWKHWPVSRPPSSNGDLWLCHVSGCRRAAGGQLNQGAIVSRRRNSQETSREMSPGAKLNILSFVDHFVNFSFASSWFQWLEAWWKGGFDPHPTPASKKVK